MVSKLNFLFVIIFFISQIRILGQIILSNAQGAEGTYDLEIHALSDQGEQSAAYPGIALAAGSTQAVPAARAAAPAAPAAAQVPHPAQRCGSTRAR